MKEKKLKWIKESDLSKYNDLEKLSLFKIRRLKKDIENIERENEELLKKIKSNKEIIRKYNKGVKDKEKLITSFKKSSADILFFDFNSIIHKISSQTVSDLNYLYKINNGFWFYYYETRKLRNYK